MSGRPAHTPVFAHVRVADCMHSGIYSCDEHAPLEEVVAIMASRRVHAVAVTGRDGKAPIAVASSLDVVAALERGEELTAGQVAGTEHVSVSADESLGRAVQLMAEHGVSHLIVLDGASGQPKGVLSTLDVVAVAAAR